MKMNKKQVSIIVITLVGINVLVALFINFAYHEKIAYQFNITSDKGTMIQIQEDISLEVLDDKQVKTIENIDKKTPLLIENEILVTDKYMKIKFPVTQATTYFIADFNIYKGDNYQNAMDVLASNLQTYEAEVMVSANSYKIHAKNADSYVVVEMDESLIQTVFNNSTQSLLKSIGWACSGVTLVLCFLIALSCRNVFLKDLYSSRSLIWNLGKIDFKTKYAGSIFGVVWAFVQPVVTVLLYWFVFQVGLRSGNVGDFPFVLWLMCGLVPWFFFQDGITSITNCFVEYSYLVKKVVFKIDILPIVKIISALFVHLFFIAVMLIIFCLMGYLPTLSAIQILYYMVCTIALVLSIGYATSSILIFFKDLGQIIQIFLQVGMWMTPIMWNIDMLPKSIAWIFEFNPMYYIVNGFRDALINHIWVWDRMNETISFWLIVIAMFYFGTSIFKHLKAHFADIL